MSIRREGSILRSNDGSVAAHPKLKVLHVMSGGDLTLGIIENIFFYYYDYFK